MDVRVLEYLILIEEKGSISKAAEVIHISQSALSQSLAKIEKELHTPLFVRADNKMIPTAIGRQYLDGARRMVQIQQSTYKKIHLLSKQEKSRIRLAICNQVYSYDGSRILSTLRKAFPQIHFEFCYEDSLRLHEFLVNDIIDAAFLCTNTASDNLINYHPLYEEHLVLVVPSDNAWDGDQIDFEQLKKSSFIYPAEDTFLYSRIHNFMKKQELIFTDVYKVSSVIEAKLLMEQGYGATFLPSRMAGDTSNCRIYSLDSLDPFDIKYAFSKYNAKKEILEKILQESLKE